MYSDYLCPWCWPAAVRVRKLLREAPGKFLLRNKAFLLRPDAQINAKFSSYHLAHRDRARAITGLPYGMPKVGEPYPSSSLPALVAAKWVTKENPDRFDEFDLALFSAFFEHNEDISSKEVLGKIAEQVGCDRSALQQAINDTDLVQEVISDYNTAQQQGITAIPTVIIGEEVITGAVPMDVYRAAATRVLWVR